MDKNCAYDNKNTIFISTSNYSFALWLTMTVYVLISSWFCVKIPIFLKLLWWDKTFEYLKRQIHDSSLQLKLMQIPIESKTTALPFFNKQLTPCFFGTIVGLPFLEKYLAP